MCSASAFVCSEFSLFPAFAATSMGVYFVLRKPVVTSAEQEQVSFLRYPFQPCFSHSVLFHEKSLYFAHECSHPFAFAGLVAEIRNLRFLLLFRAAQWEISFVGNSQNPNLTAQIYMAP